VTGRVPVCRVCQVHRYSACTTTKQQSCAPSNNEVSDSEHGLAARPVLGDLSRMEKEVRKIADEQIEEKLDQQCASASIPNMHIYSIDGTRTSTHTRCIHRGDERRRRKQSKLLVSHSLAESINQTVLSKAIHLPSLIY
jgi:hypothetical protein